MITPLFLPHCISSSSLVSLHVDPEVLPLHSEGGVGRVDPLTLEIFQLLSVSSSPRYYLEVVSNLKCFQFHPQFCPRGCQLPQFIQAEPELLVWVSEASDIVSHGAGEIILRVAELSSLLYHHPQSLIELSNANIDIKLKY